VWASSGLGLDHLPAERPAVEAFTGRVPLAFANRSRPDEAFPLLYGGSQIVDASGAVLAEATDEIDVVLVADVRLPRS
jgi:predicted amidohydrolase